MNEEEIVETRGRHRKGFYTAVVALVFAIGLIVATTELAREARLPWLVNQKDRLLAAEVAVFGIIIVEAFGHAIIARFRERDARQLGVAG